jgi:hypothetical protein
MKSSVARCGAESLASAGLALLCLLTMNCTREAQVDAGTSDTQTVKVEETRGQNIVEVDHPDQFPLVTVEQRRVPTELRVTGVVAPDVDRTVPVLSLVGGRAVEIRATLGDENTGAQHRPE